MLRMRHMPKKRVFSCLVLSALLLGFSGCTKTELSRIENTQEAVQAAVSKSYKVSTSEVEVEALENPQGYRIFINQDAPLPKPSQGYKEATLLCGRIEGHPGLEIYTASAENLADGEGRELYVVASKEMLEGIAKTNGLTLEKKDLPKLLEAIEKTEFHHETPSTEERRIPSS